ncbi:MAG: FtsX-like permease family protein [Acidobacteriota bacterium]
MATNRFVLANILHRPTRALASMISVSLEVVLILMVVGFTRGMAVDSANRQQGIGADIFLQPPNAPLIFTTSGVVMPIETREKVAAVPGVRAVAPVLYQLEVQKGLVAVFGIDLDSFSAVSGGFDYVSGGPFSGPKANETIIDNLESASKNLKVGDFQEFKGRRLKVVGVVKHGKGARVFMPIEAMQEMVGGVGKASMMFIKCEDPERSDQVIQALHQALPGYGVFSVQEWVSRIMNTNPPVLDLFLNVVVGIAVIIGSFAIFLSLYTTIAERTRDIGIFKSLGASKAYIVNLILLESLLLCLFGLALGLGLTFVAKTLLTTVYPTQQVVVSFSWILRAAVLVFLSGLLGAIYPAWRAAGKDPISSLAYE